MTPLEKTEALYEELVSWYQDGDKKELRAASKLLMVALNKLHEHGPREWGTLVNFFTCSRNSSALVVWPATKLSSTNPSRWITWAIPRIRAASCLSI